MDTHGSKKLFVCGAGPRDEFAAALITIMVPKREHKQYVKKAWAGSKDDALLAQNMAANFASLNNLSAKNFACDGGLAMKTRLRRIRTSAGTPFGLCRWLSRGVLAVTLVSGLFAQERTFQ